MRRLSRLSSGYERNGDLSPTTPFGKLTTHHGRMGTSNNNTEVADRFSVAAKQFCSIVDSASHMDRSEFVAQIYRVLPKLIDQAIEMPDVEGSNREQRKSSPRVRHEEWKEFYNSLKEKLGDWDLYYQDSSKSAGVRGQW